MTQDDGRAAGVVVRRATPADAPALGRLGALLVEEHHAMDPQRFIPARKNTPQGYAAFLGSQLDEPDVVVLVAEKGATVVGYSYAEMQGYDWMSLRGPAAALHDIVVDRDHRRGGIGARLLEATIADLKSRGAPRIVLSTAQRNAAAQRLFERMGFRRTMIEMTRELE